MNVMNMMNEEKSINLKQMKTTKNTLKSERVKNDEIIEKIYYCCNSLSQLSYHVNFFSVLNRTFSYAKRDKFESKQQQQHKNDDDGRRKKIWP